MPACPRKARGYKIIYYVNWVGRTRVHYQVIENATISRVQIDRLELLVDRITCRLTPPLVTQGRKYRDLRKRTVNQHIANKKLVSLCLERVFATKTESTSK